MMKLPVSVLQIRMFGIVFVILDFLVKQQTQNRGVIYKKLRQEITVFSVTYLLQNICFLWIFFEAMVF